MKNKDLEKEIAVLNAKMDMVLEILKEEKTESKKVHSNMAGETDRLSDKVAKMDKVQHGIIITLGLLATSCGYVAKRVLGI